VFAALTAVGVTPELAVAVALAQHGAQLVAAIAPGVLVAWSRAVA
jgi:ACR3 family arsenite efflux pump ArsB